MVAQELIDKVLARSQDFDLEGFVLGEGPDDAEIMLVGEAPGGDEIKKGRPFTGQAGKLLDASLESAGMNRQDVYITSAVRSRPFKDKVGATSTGKERRTRSNRTPVPAEIKAHAPILDVQIEAIQPKLIIVMGGIALKRLLPNAGPIAELHGKVIETPILRLDQPFTKEERYVETARKYLLYPVHHPASVIYNSSLKETIAEDFGRLQSVFEQAGIGIRT